MFSLPSFALCVRLLMAATKNLVSNLQVIWSASSSSAYFSSVFFSFIFSFSPLDGDALKRFEA